MFSPPPLFPAECLPSLPDGLRAWIQSLQGCISQLEAQNAQLGEQVQQQAETIRELRDEIAVLKGQKGRPIIKPSRMDKETDKAG